MTTTNRKKKKTCFVISAIGKSGSATRKLADAVLNGIIQESLNIQSFNYKAERIDSKGGAGDITEGIIDMLLTAELVIVDLTDLNANVMYEMGIRQAWDLPLIPIIHGDQFGNLPFDIKDLNTVPYFPKTKNNNIDFARKRETIRQIKNQVWSIKKGDQKHTVFFKAFSEITKKSTSDIVYVALSGALADIDASLYDAKQEFAKTLNAKDPTSLDAFSAHLLRIFTRMEDKRHTLGYFARGRPDEPTDDVLQELLSESQKIAEIGTKIDRLLNGGESNKINRDDIDNAFVSAMNLIAKIASKIETNK